MMKKLYLLSAIVILSCRHKEDPALVHHLQTLLDADDFFQFDRQFSASAQDLSSKNRLYFAAYHENIFNQNEACVATVDSINLAEWPDSTQANLLLLQSDSYSKLGRYAKAAYTDSLVIHKYPKALDSNTLDGLKNELLIRNALKNIPPEEATINENTTVHWTRDSFGILEIPVTTKSQTVSAIFDTRANISSITKTYAEKLHLQILPVTYRESAGITGTQFRVGLGIADSLYIGSVLVRNAVFQVMPDSILDIAGKFQINIIVGFTIIRQLQQFSLYSNGNLTIPQNPGKGGPHNLALDGLDPVMALAVNNDTLGFDFDTGAQNTILYASFFEKYKNTLLKSAVKKQRKFGGAGGIRTKETYTLPSLALDCSHRSVTIDSVSVLTQKTSPNEKLYGNIGQDFMKQYTELTLDFRDMFVTAH